MLAAVLWNLIAGIVLGVLVGGWLLRQIVGELLVEWECRRPVHVDQPVEQVIQERRPRGHPRVTSPAVLPGIGKRVRPGAVTRVPPPHGPIIAQAEVIEVKRA